MLQKSSSTVWWHPTGCDLTWRLGAASWYTWRVPMPICTMVKAWYMMFMVIPYLVPFVMRISIPMKMGWWPSLIYIYIYIYIIGSKFWPRHIESKGEKSFLASAEKGWNMMEVNTSAAWPLFCNLQDVMMFTGQIIMTYMGMGQNPIPLVNIKIAGKWMFIPLKTVL